MHAEAQHDEVSGGQGFATSSVPNEGKTELASAYASSAGNAGIKVSIVTLETHLWAVYIL